MNINIFKINLPFLPNAFNARFEKFYFNNLFDFNTFLNAK